MHTHPALQAHGTCARVEGSVRAGVARQRRVEAVLLAPFNLLLSARAEAVEVIALRPRAIAIEVTRIPPRLPHPAQMARWFVNGGSDASAGAVVVTMARSTTATSAPHRIRSRSPSEQGPRTVPGTTLPRGRSRPRSG